MAKILSVDEMMVAAAVTGMPGNEAMEAELREFADRLAKRLAHHLQVDGPRSIDFLCDPQGGGVLGGFAPFEAGQPLPQVLANFDSLGDWVPRPDARSDGGQAQVVEDLKPTERQDAAQRLGQSMAKLHALDLPPISEDEVEKLVQETRRALRPG